MFPEGLHLSHEDYRLSIADQQGVGHVEFFTANGDSCAWSRNIITSTCRALGVTQAVSDGDFMTIGKAIRSWHAALGAKDGFLP
jgi:hypothetical protein